MAHHVITSAASRAALSACAAHSRATAMRARRNIFATAFRAQVWVLSSMPASSALAVITTDIHG